MSDANTLSPRSRSPSVTSDSSGYEYDNYGPPGASRPQSTHGSPAPDAFDGPPLEVETVTCQWEECGKPFTDLQLLIDHIHNEHIGVHKSTYTCEWATCPRRGLSQTSRFALISHIRSHTGEKPFTCPLPECDKSFTRSDALAKHMRVQHNISPPMPGRGGSRKRKRGDDDVDGVPANVKTEGADEDELVRQFQEEAAASSARASPGIETPNQHLSESSESEDLPEYLTHESRSSRKGMVMDRPPYMVKYLIAKAKYKYALSEHELLLDELVMARKEEERIRESKERLLDDVLRRSLGPQAESVIVEPTIPPRERRDHRRIPVDPR